MTDPSSGGRVALLLGATGLVGSHCLDLLLADARYERIRSLVRRPLERAHAKLEAVVVDFDQLDQHRQHFRAHDVFCCLGTTLRAAGSREAFRRVDYHLVVRSAALAAEQGAERFLLVSAVGADPGSRFFYNWVKGEAERSVRELPLTTWIVRPSLLLGERRELRPGERMAALLAKPLSPLLRGPLRRYRPVHARAVAATMLALARRGGKGGVVESEEIGGRG